MLNIGYCSVNDVMAPNNNLLNLELACGHSSKFNITKCNPLRCKFKADFQPRDKAVGSVTKLMYDFVVPSEITSLNSH